MNRSNEKLYSIGTKARRRLQLVLALGREFIRAQDVVDTLGVSSKRAYELLSYWCTRGWLQRVKRGVYAPVPLESPSPERSIEDPWVLAHQIFGKCYLGSWTALQHWDLTEQIFETTVVYTTKNVHSSQVAIKNCTFLVRRIKEDKLFGLQRVWRGREKVAISDPSRTIIDMLHEPQVCGGIQFVEEMLVEYIRSDKRNDRLLVEYATRNKNKAVFKRLGFLIEKNFPNAHALIDKCQKNLSKGLTRLDPSIKEGKYNMRWRLQCPKGMLM